MTTAVSSNTTRSVRSSIVNGALAGIGGGIVFGMLMAMMGMLPMVAMLVKSDNHLVGMLVHLAISAGLGALYGMVAARLPLTLTAGAIAGALYGVVWWILGALILMPLLLGMSQMMLQIGQPQWFSLMGHMLYGVVTGILFVVLSRRA